MPLKKRTGGKPSKRPIERYEHSDKKRINNPPVGLVTPETDPVAPTHGRCGQQPYSQILRHLPSPLQQYCDPRRESRKL